MTHRREAGSFGRKPTSAAHSNKTRLRGQIAILGHLVFFLLILTGCAGISVAELDKIGSTITTVDLDFNEFYAYALRSGTAYDSDAVIKAKYPLTIRINAPQQTKVKYFLERDDKAHRQFITVRGTDNNKNLDEDLTIAVREDRKIDIPVHHGFDSSARAIDNDVKPYLKPGYKTYLTGHSLGAAVAALLAVYLIEDGVPVERVVTFGQPRFTTAEGAKRLTFLPLTRVVDENDIIPLIAPSTVVLDPRFGPYEQVGAEVILLEGPDYVYLPVHDADRISLGEFWRSFTFANLQDHHIEKYLRRIADKTRFANQVPYTERERFVLANPVAAAQ
jgi:triacylglycerol lipase